LTGIVALQTQATQEGQQSEHNPMQRPLLYAPFRERYMNNAFTKKTQSNKKKKCVFCADIEATNDVERLVLTRFEYNTVFLNLFPYQRGQVLIIPNQHAKDLESLSLETRQELMEIIAAAPTILQNVLGALGTNIGINIGKIAGASKPDHVHIHVLPRYQEEHKAYIQLLGETHVVQWDLSKLYFDLKPAFDDLKKQLCRNTFDIQNYYESGIHEQETEAVLQHAWKKLETICPKQNYLVIIDIDETALSNYEYFKKNGWQKDSEDNFAQWKALQKTPAIIPMLQFYEKLICHGFKIIFISSRADELLPETQQNLIDQGYHTFEKIILRSPEEQSELFSSAVFSSFKTKKRKELVEQGYEIIACIGDQWSDLQGDNTGIKIKVPTFFE